MSTIILRQGEDESPEAYYDKERSEVFCTDLLVVRCRRQEDDELILSLWNDPRVMTHVGFSPGLHMTRERLVEQYLRRGGTKWASRTRSTRTADGGRGMGVGGVQDGTAAWHRTSSRT